MFSSFVLIIILTGLGAIHISWALGSEFCFRNSIPTKETGQPVISPGKIDCWVVGIGLILFSMFYFNRLGVLEIQNPLWVNQYVQWIIPSIFLLRAIGDFRYIGFFKQVRKTKFAQLDTYYYSPLCGFISLLGILNTGII